MKSENGMIERIVRGHDEFATLCRNVEATYLAHYGSIIQVNPKEFVAMRMQADGNPWGACFGVNYAEHAALFSERYLGQASEDCLRQLIGKEIGRDQIAECGSFASFDSKGAGKQLLVSLPWILWTSGIHYALVTVTPQVQTLFKYLEMPFLPVCQASPMVLSEEERRNWAAYYDSQPVAGFLDIRQAFLNSIDSRSGAYAINSLSVGKHDHRRAA